VAANFFNSPPPLTFRHYTDKSLVHGLPLSCLVCSTDPFSNVRYSWCPSCYWHFSCAWMNWAIGPSALTKRSPSGSATWILPISPNAPRKTSTHRLLLVLPSLDAARRHQRIRHPRSGSSLQRNYSRHRLLPHAASEQKPPCRFAGAAPHHPISLPYPLVAGRAHVRPGDHVRGPRAICLLAELPAPADHRGDRYGAHALLRRDHHRRHDPAPRSTGENSAADDANS